MAELSEDDIRFVLSADPDDDALNKAIRQINDKIDRAEVSKLKLQLEGKSEPTVRDKAMQNIQGKKEAGAVNDMQKWIEGGGALGAAGRGIGSVVSGVGKLAAAPFKVLNAGLGLFSDALHDIQGPLGPIGAGLNLFTKGLTATADAVGKIPILGSLLGPLLGTLGKLPTILKGILESGMSLAGKASPGTVRGMSIAVEDFQATVGQMFIPVVELMTTVVQDLADVVANFLPNANEMRDALATVRKAWSAANTSLKEVAAEFGPKVRDVIADTLKTVGSWLGDAMPDLDQTKSALTWIQDMWTRVIVVVKDAANQAWEFGKGLVNSFRETFGSIDRMVNELRWMLDPKGMKAEHQAAQANVVLRAQEDAAKFNVDVNEEMSRGGVDREEATKVVRGRRQEAPSTTSDDWGSPATVFPKADRDPFRTRASAARTPFMGGIDEYQRRLQLQTAGGPAGMGQADMPRNVGNLTQMVGSIKEWFAKMTPQQIEALVKAGAVSPSSTRRTLREAEPEIIDDPGDDGF